MKWIRRRVQKQSRLHVSLYSKPGCHLCDEARVLLQRLSAHHNLTIDEIDITSDSDLFRQYDVRIPVIVFDDGSSVEAPVREPDVRRAINRNIRRY